MVTAAGNIMVANTMPNSTFAATELEAGKPPRHQRTGERDGDRRQDSDDGGACFR
ncbi:hypothetical protein [Arthrobacter pigmenti]